MIKLKYDQMDKIEYLFNDIRFYMGKSVLDGLMGEAYTDNLEKTTVAYLLVRKYCFINGNYKSYGVKININVFKKKEFIQVGMQTI